MAHNVNETGSPQLRTILVCRHERSQSPLIANRPQQMPNLPRIRPVSRQPSADDEPAVRPKNAGHFGQEASHVHHVFCALDSQDDVERIWSDIVTEPITEHVTRRIGLIVHATARIDILRFRNGEADNARSKLAREDASRGAIPAAHVADHITGSNAGVLDHEIDQLSDRLFGSLIPREPETVMEMFAPKLPVERVDFVVVSSDFSDLRLMGRGNHACQ